MKCHSTNRIRSHDLRAKAIESVQVTQLLRVDLGQETCCTGSYAGVFQRGAICVGVC